MIRSGEACSLAGETLGSYTPLFLSSSRRIVGNRENIPRIRKEVYSGDTPTNRRSSTSPQAAVRARASGARTSLKPKHVLRPTESAREALTHAREEHNETNFAEERTWEMVASHASATEDVSSY